MKPTTSPTPRTSLGDLAASQAGASRVLHRHGLDFCCGGQQSLAEACAARGLDPALLLAEIEREAPAAEGFERWDERPLGELIEHILDRYHEGHRRELPRLIEMAQKVERVHADKPTCPRGLAQHLERMAESMEDHMQKEEQILFPVIAAGRGRIAGAPIQVMESEHKDHAANLERLRKLAHGYQPPAEACGTWSALYARLAELERELMGHMHLENHVLFPRALRS